MSKLDHFLDTLTGINRERAKKALEKQFRTSRGVETLAEIIEHHAESPEPYLDFSSPGDTKKVNGVRFEKKPVWTIFSKGDDGYHSGTDVGLTGARYAAFIGVKARVNRELVDTPLEEIQKTVLAEWEKDNNPQARERAMYGSMGRYL